MSEENTLGATPRIMNKTQTTENNLIYKIPAANPIQTEMIQDELRTLFEGERAA